MYVYFTSFTCAVTPVGKLYHFMSKNLNCPIICCPACTQSKALLTVLDDPQHLVPDTVLYTALVFGYIKQSS